VGYKRLSVASVIRDDQGRVLLVKQTYGHLNWELPGGDVEPGETIVDAATREVKEEAGIEVTADEVTGIYDEQDMNYLHIVVVCHTAEPTPLPRADLTEVSACDFWPVDALPRPVSDYTVRRIRDGVGDKKLRLPLPFVVTVRRWAE
jgi:8-oxo-dGTP diphosphatase